MEENKNYEAGGNASLVGQADLNQSKDLAAAETVVSPPPPRKKRLFSKFIIWFLGILIFLAALFFSFPHIMGIVAGGDIERPEFSDLELRKVEVPDSENSFLDLFKLSGGMIAGEHREAQIKIDFSGEITEMDYLESYDRDERVVEELLDKNKDALNVFSDAAGKSVFQDIHIADPENIKSTMPVVALNKWRSASRLNGIKAIYLMKQGREPEAFEEAIKSLQVGSAIERAENITTIEYLLGMAIKEGGLKVLDILVDRTSLSSQELGKIQGSLLEYKTKANANFLKAEFMVFQEAIDQIMAGAREETGLLEPPVNGYYFKPNQTLLNSVQFLRDDIIFHESACLVGPTEREKFQAVTWKMFFTENVVGKMLLSLSHVAMNNVKQKKCEREAELDNVVLQLAIKRYLFDKGEYPASLGVLVPDYLEKYPEDEFSVQELRFDGDKKIVYSVGRNFIDDKGSLSDDIVASFDFSVTQSSSVEPVAQGFEFIDSDGDGLYDFEEAWYGTDMHNPDSDGDGYSDGDEVMAGYDPAGPGFLKASHNTPEGAILMLEQAQFNCDKDYFVSTFVDAFDLGLMNAEEKLFMSMAEMDENFLKSKVLNEFYEYRVYANDIKNIEVLGRQFMGENIIHIDYLLHYQESASSKPPAKNKYYIVSLGGDGWKVDVNEILSHELRESSDLEIQTARARDAKRVADIKQIQTANELYYNEESRYIEKISAGQAFVGGKNTYMNTIPDNPPAKSGECLGFGEYRYRLLEGSESYELVYCLERGVGSVPAGINIASEKGLSERRADNSGPKEYKSCQ